MCLFHFKNQETIKVDITLILFGQERGQAAYVVM